MGARCAPRPATVSYTHLDVYKRQATSRGLGVEDMDKIAEYIALAINDFENSADSIRKGVTELCAKYPLY